MHKNAPRIYRQDSTDLRIENGHSVIADRPRRTAWTWRSAKDLGCDEIDYEGRIVLFGAITGVDHASMLGGAGNGLPQAEIDATAEIGLRLHLNTRASADADLLRCAARR